MSDALKAKRKKLAQPLRDLALTYKTYRVRDDANRKKGEGMASALLKKRGVPAEKKLEAQEALQKYLATFGPERPAQSAAEPERLPFRRRGSSFLFTYNWSFLTRPFPDGKRPHVVWKATS